MDHSGEFKLEYLVGLEFNFPEVSAPQEDVDLFPSVVVVAVVDAEV